MILVDTSLWVDHLGGRPVPGMAELLENERVLMHRFVFGEVVLGSLADRRGIAALLRGLHHLPTATDAEVTALIEWAPLHGTGVGYIDAHLLAATKAVAGCTIWTRDRKLKRQAHKLGIAEDR